MARFCTKCGASLNEDAKFCTGCGSVAELEQTAQINKEAPPKSTVNPQAAVRQAQSAVNTVSKLTGVSLAAPSVAGEAALGGGFNPMSTVSQIAGPFAELFGGISRIFKGFAAAFKNKKALIPAIILAVTWIGLTLLPMLGVNPLPVQLLSALTFAQGGMSNNALGIVGGLLGKGMFATLFVSLFNGRLNGMGRGLKDTFSAFKNKTAGQLGMLLAGAGLALVTYNFIAGYASLWQGMAGVSGLLLSLRALGGGNGFIRKIFTSLTAKKTSNGKVANTAALNQILAGLTTGFALSLVLSAIPWGYTPYCVGGAALLAGAVLALVGGGKKEAAA